MHSAFGIITFRNLLIGAACGMACMCCAQPPRRPVPAQSSPVASATTDTQAMALLQKVEKTMLGLNTYQAECATTLTFPPQNGKPAREKREFARLLAAKPNKMRYDQWSLKKDAKTGEWTRIAGKQGITFVCNGATNWKQFGDHYRTDTFTQPEALGTILEPWSGFYAAVASPHDTVMEAQKQHELLELRLAGREQVEGTACDKVFTHIKTNYQGEAQEYWDTWYIAGDGMARRRVERIEFSGKPGYTRDSLLRHIRVNAPIPASQFVYTPPKGVLSAKEVESRRPALLAAGAIAPDFTALDVNQKPVKLSDFRGKVVVLDFWASWCGPCMRSMPHTQEVAQKLKAEGLPVVLLAVDNSEERTNFLTWVQAKSASLSALTFVHVPPTTDVRGKLYHISGIPTQYVVDKKGIVCASFVGYSQPTNDLETSVRAALASPRASR